MPTTSTTSGGLNTRAEACMYLKTSRSRLDELIRSGAIAAVRDGRSVKIATSELERYIRELPSFESAS